MNRKGRERMKSFWVIMAVCLLSAGCHYGGRNPQGYLEDPATLLEDPLSVDHQQELDELERRYLHKEITYAEYVEQKQQLEDDFVRDVRKREGRLDEY